MIRRATTLAIVVILSGCTESIDPIETDAPVRPTTLVIGDSLSEGGYQARNWPDLVNDRRKKRLMSNRAKGGSRALRCLAQWEHARRQQPWTTVIVWCGINDLIDGATADQIIATLSVITEEAREDGARVLPVTMMPWGGCPYWNPEQQRQTERLDAWIASQEAFVPIDELFRQPGDPSMPAEIDLGDGLHQNDRGAQLLSIIFDSYL